MYSNNDVTGLLARHKFQTNDNDTKNANAEHAHKKHIQNIILNTYPVAQLCLLAVDRFHDEDRTKKESLNLICQIRTE